MSDELMFAEESDEAEVVEQGSWTILIVDDEEEVHSVTRLALRGFTFQGRKLNFLDAYSGAEAKSLMSIRNDIALVLLDVVMETDHAGLDVVEFVRSELRNKFMRIILRTGQPGMAPEIEVIRKYDINDYKYKTELTRERLFTAVYAGLSAYRDLVALEGNRRGLEKVIEGSAQIFEMRSIERFAQGVLEQLAALMYLDRNCLMVQSTEPSGVAARGDGSNLTILAGTGDFLDAAGANGADGLPADVILRLGEAKTNGQMLEGPDFTVIKTQSGELMFYVDAPMPKNNSADRRLVEMFCKNVEIAHDNLLHLAAAKKGLGR